LQRPEGAGAGGSGGLEGLRAGVWISISILLEASWLKLPARQEELGARVSIAIEGIEGLESFYESMVGIGAFKNNPSVRIGEA
jgi:hypothetical protein